MEEGGFLYDSDSYADDLPYWTTNSGSNSVADSGNDSGSNIDDGGTDTGTGSMTPNHKPHLIIPYTLSENDMRFAIPNGFSHSGEFFTMLKDSLDYLIEEASGPLGAPKMMSVGLHCRLVGRPGRAAGLKRFLKYVKGLGEDVVCVCTREQIANHWHENHLPEMSNMNDFTTHESRP